MLAERRTDCEGRGAAWSAGDNNDDDVSDVIAKKQTVHSSINRKKETAANISPNQAKDVPQAMPKRTTNEPDDAIAAAAAADSVVAVARRLGGKKLNPSTPVAANHPNNTHKDTVVEDLPLARGPATKLGAAAAAAAAAASPGLQFTSRT